MAPVHDEPYPVSEEDLLYALEAGPPAVSMLPEWLYDAAVDDATFAVAYDAVPPEYRACIKTTTAYHYNHFPPQPALSARLGLEEPGGVSTTVCSAPCDWAVVLLHERFTSPVRCAAALLPPLLAGVHEVCMVRLVENSGSDWPPALLTAAELVGVETVADLYPEDVARLLDELADAGRPGVVLTPGADGGRHSFSGVAAEALDRLCATLGTDALWRPRPVTEGRIWATGNEEWDWDVLTWAHPDMHFTVWSGPNRDKGPDLPPNFEVLDEGDPIGFFLPGPTVLYAPESMLGHWTGDPRLVLGPGCEGGWIWPSLTPDRFMVRGRAWNASNRR